MVSMVSMTEKKVLIQIQVPASLRTSAKIQAAKEEETLQQWVTAWIEHGVVEGKTRKARYARLAAGSSTR